MAACSRRWSKRLRDRFTLHVVDLPGHGLSRDSDVPLALEACVDAIADARAARAVVRLVAGRTVRVAGGGDAAAAGAGAGDAVREPALRARRSTGNLACRRRSSATSPPACAATTAARSIASSRWRRSARSTRRTRSARCATSCSRAANRRRSVLADGLELLETSRPARSVCRRCRVPSLWLAGRRDRLVDPRAMRDAAALAPGARFAVIEHAGHAPFLTHADAVAARLASIPGRRHDHAAVRHPPRPPRVLARAPAATTPRPRCSTKSKRGCSNRWTTSKRREPQTVLDLGCGPGRAAAAMRQRWPQAHVLALDLALPMLRAGAQRRTARRPLRKPRRPHLRRRARAAAGRQQRRRAVLQPVPAVGRGPAGGVRRLPARAQAGRPAAGVDFRSRHAARTAQPRSPRPTPPRACQPVRDRSRSSATR